MQPAQQFNTAQPTQQFDIQKYEHENNQYRQEIENLVQKNQSLANEFRAKTEQIQRDMEAKLALFIPILKNGGDLGANLQSSSEENNRLKAELAQKNQYIAQLENQNKASQQEIHRLNSVLAQNQDAFQRQRNQDQGIINQLQTQVVLLENNLRAEATEVVHLKNEVKNQKQRVSHNESEINDLKKQLRDAKAHAVSNKLQPDGTLNQGEFLTSKNGNYKVIMQEDANLVLYDQFKKAIWSSDSYKTKIQGPYHLRMQGDGNLVIYGRNNQPVWASDTFQKGAGSSCLVLQDKGKLVIKDRNEAEQWSS